MAVAPERLNRGTIVLVLLPGDKASPAVVLRSNALARLPYATVVAFTTTAHGEPDLRLPVAPTPVNGLRQQSFAMVDWPQTIRAEHMGDIVGHPTRPRWMKSPVEWQWSSVWANRVPLFPDDRVPWQLPLHRGKHARCSTRANQDIFA